MSRGAERYAANLAGELLACGRHAEAVTAFQLALLEDPQDAGLLLGLAEALLPTSPREAERNFRRALVADPCLAAAHNGLGCLYHTARRSELAFRRAVDLDPINVVYRCNLANSLCRQDRFDEAIACLAEALEIYPDEPAASEMLGEIYLDRGMFDRAEQLFAVAVRDFDLDPFLERDVWQWYERGDHELAERRFRRLTARCALPPCGWAFFGLGRALLARRKPGHASDVLRVAVCMNPQRPDYHLALANALEAERHPTAAASARRRAEVLSARVGGPRLATEREDNTRQVLVELL